MIRSAAAVSVAACLVAAPVFAASAATATTPAAAPAAPAAPAAAKPAPAKAAISEPDIPAQIWGVGASPYPPEARKLNQEGDVVISVLVGEDGKVRDAKIKTSSGFPMLDQAALKLFKNAVHYSPGIKNGKPVASWIDARTGFHLADAESGPQPALAKTPAACYDEPLTRGFLRPGMQGIYEPYRQILIDEKGIIIDMRAWGEGRWVNSPADDIANVAAQLKFQPAMRDGQPVKCWFDYNKPAPRKEETPADALGPDGPAAAVSEPDRGSRGGGARGGGMGGIGSGGAMGGPGGIGSTP